MNEKKFASIEILALFSAFKEKRLKLYESFIKDIDDFDDWVISAERLLAYYITARNLKEHGNDLKEKIQKEIVRLHEGDFIIN